MLSLIWWISGGFSVVILFFSLYAATESWTESSERWETLNRNPLLLSPQSWFLWQGLWIHSSRCVIRNWKAEKQTHSPLVKNKLLKRSFSPNTIESTTTEPENSHSAPMRTPTSARFTQECLSPFTQEAWTRLSGQTRKNTQERKRKMRNKLWNARTETQHRKLTNDQFNIFFLLLKYIYLYIYFLLSPQWNSMHWLRDPQKNIVHGGVACDVAQTSYQCISPSHIALIAVQAPPLRVETCVSPRSAAWFPQSWAFLLFQLANHSHAIWWRDAYLH